MEQEITAHIDEFISVTVISITVKIKNLDTRKGDYVIYPRSKKIGPSLKIDLLNLLNIIVFKPNNSTFHFFFFFCFCSFLSASSMMVRY